MSNVKKEAKVSVKNVIIASEGLKKLMLKSRYIVFSWLKYSVLFYKQ